MYHLINLKSLEITKMRFNIYDKTENITKGSDKMSNPNCLLKFFG